MDNDLQFWRELHRVIKFIIFDEVVDGSIEPSHRSYGNLLGVNVTGRLLFSLIEQTNVTRMIS